MKIENRLEFNFEVHAVDLMQGRRDFEGVTLPTRIEIAKELLDVVEIHDLDVIFAALDKKRHSKRYRWPDPPQKVTFMLLVEAFERYLKECDGERFGMLIADENSDGRLLKDKLSEYQEAGTPYLLGRPIRRIIDSIHFVSSHDSACIQLSDLCNYFIYQRLKNPPRRYAQLERRVMERVSAQKRFP